MRVRAFLVALCLCLPAPVLAQVSPESAQTYQEGQELFQKRRYQDAITAFEEAVKIDGKNAQAYQAIGITYQKLRNWKKAIKAHQMAATVKPDYAAAYYAVGEVQFQRLRDYEAAEKNFKKVLSIDPGFQRGKSQQYLKAAYLRQGGIYFRSKSYKKAVGQYENASQLDPSDASAFYNLGLAHKAARNSRKAREALQTAVDLDPKHARAFESVGDVYKDIQRYSQAAKNYNRSIAVEPGHMDAYLSLAEIYVENTKQPGKAVAILRKAVAVPTEKVAAYYSKIKSRAKPNKKRSAAYRQLGYAYAKQRNYKSAIANYWAALKLTPNDDLIYYRMSEVYLDSEAYQSAINTASKAFDSRKYGIPAHIVAANAYEKLKPEGWQAKAIRHYEKGLKDRRYQKHCEDKIDRIKNPMGSTETDEAQ